MTARLLPLLALLLSSHLAGPAPAAAAEPPDALAAARDSLRAAELAFAASVRERDREAFASFIASDAIFVGDPVLRGRAAIVEGWAAFFAVGGPTLEWHPERVEVQAEGDLGVTRGPYTLTRTGEDGAVVRSSGTFTSVWRRQADGGWKIEIDAGCPHGGE